MVLLIALVDSMGVVSKKTFDNKGFEIRANSQNAMRLLLRLHVVQ